jgi:ubiquinone/menaquinone biosynthesis C-methylase UbiE
MIKTQMEALWTAGDFGQIAKFTEPTAETFIERRGMTQGMQVLDAACGTGNAASRAPKIVAQFLSGASGPCGIVDGQ